MVVFTYRIGKLDPALGGYTLEIFDAAGTRVTPSPGAAPEVLSRNDVDSVAWNPGTIRATFDNPSALRKELLDAGREMFSWLDRGTVGATWRKLRQGGAATLIDVVDPSLSELPWELMLDGALLIFGAPPDVARVRLVAADMVDDDWPMRLWIVNGAPENPEVDAEREIRRIKAELLWHRHSIDVKVDVPKDQKDFEDTLIAFRPHILHFIGHGGLSSTSGIAALFVAATKPWELDATAVRSALANARVKPRFAFLNACHTANRATAYAVADAFSSAGVPATLTMQGAVQGDEAGRYAAEVYRQLAGGTDLLRAVASARVIFDQGRPHHWAFPVLWLSGAPDGLLPLPPMSLDSRFKKGVSCRIFEEVRLFGGRADERRRLRLAVCPIEKSAAHHLIVVVGKARLGKSHLVKRCLECLNLRGHNTHYVEVADTSVKNQLEFLLDMFKDEDPALAFPELTRARQRFRWEVKQILDRGAVAVWDGATVVSDPLTFDASALKTENALELLAQSALDALRDASLAEPLFIVFDRFRSKGGELAVSNTIFTEFLWPQLFSRIRNGELPNVFVGLILSDHDAAHEYRVLSEVDMSEVVQVNDPPSTDFEELVAEMFGYLESDKLHGMDEVAAVVKKGVGTSTTATLLKQMQELADDMIPGKAHRTHVGRSR